MNNKNIFAYIIPLLIPLSCAASTANNQSKNIELSGINYNGEIIKRVFKNSVYDRVDYGCSNCYYTNIQSVKVENSNIDYLIYAQADSLEIKNGIRVYNSNVGTVINVLHGASFTVGGLVDLEKLSINDYALIMNYQTVENGPKVNYKNGIRIKDATISGSSKVDNYSGYRYGIYWSANKEGKGTQIKSKSVEIDGLLFDDSKAKADSNNALYIRLQDSKPGANSNDYVEISDKIDIKNIYISENNFKDSLYGINLINAHLNGLNSTNDYISIQSIGLQLNQNDFEAHKTKLTGKVSGFRAYGATMNANSISINDVYAGGDAYGFEVSKSAMTVQNLDISSIGSVNGRSIGLSADNIEVSNIKIHSIENQSENNNEAFAIYASGRSSTNDKGINFGSKGSSIIEGNILLSSKTDTEYAGLINGNFLTEDSYFSGLTLYESDEFETKGNINLTFDNGAKWYVPKSNTLNGTLTLKEDSEILLGYEKDGFSNSSSSFDLVNRTDGYTHLSSSSLQTDNGNIRFNIDIGAETDPINVTSIHTDQFSFGDLISDTGTINAQIILNGSDTNKQNYTNNWLISQTGTGSLTVKGAFGSNDQYVSSRGGVEVWQIAYVNNPEDISSISASEATNTGNGAGYWYLIRPEEQDPVVPPEVEDNITIGTSASQALAYMADLEDLRKRIGEVRYGAQSGAWVKAFAKKDNVSASGGRGFEQDVYGINVGLDALAGTTESSSWLLGGAFRYARADQDGIGIASTSGNLDEYSVKAYATWMHEKGSYADFVLQAGRYEQELSGLDNTGSGSSHADYGTWGFGASVEVGHMFSFAEDADDRRWFNHFFIEPQLELSYFHARGADYSTSTGLRISQDNADFLTGRAGLVLGKKFNYGSIDELDRRFFQFALIGGVKHEFLGGDQNIGYTGVNGVHTTVHADDIDGTRFYYGLNFDWQISDSCRIFAQFDREEGDHYTKEYDFSIGAKWSF